MAARADPAHTDIASHIHKALDPYIRPREEVARIRQILAAHLDSCLEDGAAVGPLSLVRAVGAFSSSTARGLQKEYLNALNANIKARREFAACCRGPKLADEGEAATTDDQRLSHLQNHLDTIRFRQRHQKLRAVENGLNLLAQKPAASPGFLDPGEIFRDSRPLPEVPKDLLSALGTEKVATGPQLKDLIDQLERHVLQAKLLLRREEQLLEKVRARSTARPENITDSAKLEALNRTRAELISWIEAELAKAAGDDGDAEGIDLASQRNLGGAFNMEEQVASIKEKYAQYLKVRKTLLELVTQQPQPVLKPPSKEEGRPPPPPAQPAPTGHLLSPYLERLLSIGHEQKGLIAQKSHLNATISKQLKENSQVLDRLAEESQLVPAHPMPGASRSSSATGGSGPSGRVKPWVFAADSAKISTLEAVAEKIDEGQAAVEGSMRALEEIGQLLGLSPEREDRDLRGNAVNDDLWLAEGQPSGTKTGTRRHTGRRADESSALPKTIWDKLDGNLGLLRSDRDTP